MNKVLNAFELTYRKESFSYSLIGNGKFGFGWVVNWNGWLPSCEKGGVIILIDGCLQ